jgi:hypothetical protein
MNGIALMLDSVDHVGVFTHNCCTLTLITHNQLKSIWPLQIPLNGTK